MNCAHFQERLYDYLDDMLSPSEKTAAEEHLLGCGSCRQAVQSELLLARTLSTRLTQTVEAVNLDANARKGITKAALQTLGRQEPKPHRSLLSLLLLVRHSLGGGGGRRGPGRGGVQSSGLARLALPFAAAALILIGGVWLGHQLLRERAANRNPDGSLAASDSVASIHASDSVPVYTFHKEGNLVVDVLTRDTLSLDGTLLTTR
jgi:hypothetical protein